MSTAEAEILMKNALLAAQLAQEDAKKQLEAAAKQVQEASELAREQGEMARRMALEARELAEQATIQCEEVARKNLAEHTCRLVAVTLENGRKRGELKLCPVCKDSKTEVLFCCGHRFCHNCANQTASCDSCGQIVQVRVVGQ